MKAQTESTKPNREEASPTGNTTDRGAKRKGNSQQGEARPGAREKDPHIKVSQPNQRGQTEDRQGQGITPSRQQGRAQTSKERQGTISPRQQTAHSQHNNKPQPKGKKPNRTTTTSLQTERQTKGKQPNQRAQPKLNRDNRETHRTKGSKEDNPGLKIPSQNSPWG